jgi:hypothetical protein
MASRAQLKLLTINKPPKKSLKNTFRNEKMPIFAP